MKKTVKVVMLPTDKKGSLIYNTYINPTKHKANPLQELTSYLYNGEPSKIESMGYKYQHLYLTSDEEIKEGDWFLYRWWSSDNDYYVNSIKKLHKNRESDTQGYSVYDEKTYNEYHLMPNECFKIVATTDKSLGCTQYQVCKHCDCILTTCDEGKCHVCRRTGLGNWIKRDDSVPQIPKPLIEAYVDANGDIDDIELEYDLTVVGLPNLYDLAITEDNEVIVHRTNNKMYSRDEVENMIIDFNLNYGNISVKAMDKFIAENLNKMI